MLPQAAPGLGYFVSAAEMMPCQMTGGDFYEYVPLDDDTLGFTLGDVAGKGAPAGLFGAWIQEIFLAQSVRLIEPAGTISEVNNTLLKKSLESRFVTMLYGMLTRDGGLSYCNAGHKPPFLITGDGVRRLETGGLIVGLFDDAQSEQEPSSCSRATCSWSSTTASRRPRIVTARNSATTGSSNASSATWTSAKATT